MKKTVATVVCLIVCIILVFPSFVCAESIWRVQTLDTHSWGGHVVIDSKDNPHVVYTIRDTTNTSLSEAFAELKYARWTGSGWNITTLFQYVASLDFVLDSNDNPHILYRELGQSQDDILMYATLSESNWVTHYVDQEVGGGVSLALDSAGTPHAVYFALGDWKYASFNGTNWIIHTIDLPESLEGPLTTRIFLEFDSNDIAHLMYTTDDTHSINYVVGDADDWKVSTFFEGCELNDMALDSNGNPHIVYVGNVHPQDLLPIYAQWTGINWDSQNFQVPIAEYRGYPNNSKLAIDSHERPHIITSRYPPNLMYATLRGNQWDFQSIDSDNAQWDEGSIAVDSKDNPHVLYLSEGGKGLNYKTGYYLNYATADLPEISSTSFDNALLLLSSAIVVATAVAVGVFVWKKKSSKNLE